MRSSLEAVKEVLDVFYQHNTGFPECSRIIEEDRRAVLRVVWGAVKALPHIKGTDQTLKLVTKGEILAALLGVDPDFREAAE